MHIFSSNYAVIQVQVIVKKMLDITGSEIVSREIYEIFPLHFLSLIDNMFFSPFFFKKNFVKGEKLNFNHKLSLRRHKSTENDTMTLSGFLQRDELACLNSRMSSQAGCSQPNVNGAKLSCFQVEKDSETVLSQAAIVNKRHTVKRLALF